MGFGGSVSAMITSLKNNKRSRVSMFDKLKKYENVKYKDGGKIEKKATPQQLKAIRERIQKENKRTQVITLTVSIATTLVLFILFYYLKF
ncbi:MAG: hypothetical protein L3J20_12410 [Flavobacteriaceae bacterium]|nr:hypothetical protein [Flavobacteriaceae bacterium]